MKKVFCDLRLCLGCKSCELACGIEHSESKALFGTIKEERRPKKRVVVQFSFTKPAPVRCLHCQPAACVDACMSQALQKDKLTGATVHDKEKCVGCWMCIMVCPVGAPRLQLEDKIILKCDLCPDREIPACVEACPTKALIVGSREEFENRVTERKIKKI